MRTIGTILASAALCIALALPIAAFAALQTNYDWYKGHEGDASYTIGTAGELKALARLVNGTADYDGAPDGAVDFAGKTISVTGSINFVSEPLEPIGTPATPFRGCFDGSGHEVDNFVLRIDASDTETSASNVGVFGYVGEGGSVSNLSVGPYSSISIVRDAGSAEYIENVGMVVGFCAGSVTNCRNAGNLSITSAVEQQSASDYIPVRNIGGVVGQCIYDVAGCHNSGTVSVTENASPDPDIRHGQLVAYVGGVVGLAGDASRIGTYDTHIFGEADKHGEVRSCSNTALITIDTPMEGELDRFGVKASAESLAIGGVVGYSQGSVSECMNGLAQSSFLDSSNYRNVGYVRAENGVMVGGICGSLRGVHADNMNVAWADDGADGQDPLVISNCTNYGDVYARVTAGGIVGKASSYTTVTSCLNMYKTDGFGNKVESFVVATRWNKPSPGGIAGTANGEVSYCANFATIASALWSNEANRTMSTQDGYYAAGIAGMLVYFDDRAPANGGITTPVSEVFSCYNAGEVIAGAGMRQRGIVGQNDGYVHDNVLLEGVVDDDKIVYGDEAGDKEASGTVGENRVYTVKELRSEKIGEAVAFMNVNAAGNSWLNYWVISDGTGLNRGYPVLNRQDPWGENAVSIADATLELLEDAPYTGGESTPVLKVTLGEAELIENADYRVIAQEGATQPTSDRPYRARVVGLGRYAGTSDNTAAYGIVAGDFSKCTMTVLAHTFSYNVELPSADDVVVRTPVGTVVDSDEYNFAVVDDNDKAIEPVNVGAYRVVVTPKEGSVLFSGSLEGQYRIKAASFMREVKLDGTTISFLGETYPWVDSTKQGESDNPTTSLPYTGVPVKPVVGNVTYNGHELVEGVDYKVVYGNANSDEGNTGNQDENNLGKEGGRTVGCVTIRYVNSAQCNFSSYANMFFNIVDEGVKVDFTKAVWKVEGEQISDGEPLEPVEIYLGAEKLTEGVDYAISYADNIDPGQATFTATGMGRFEGELTGGFEIVSSTLCQILYSYDGTGTDEDPYEATVVGAEYYGIREGFSLSIPGTVEHEGVVYSVVAIGENAFGGSGIADFQGTVANESKLKLVEISLPASVRSIGKFGFGSASLNYTANLERIEFGEDSKLSAIGDYAFAQCTKLKSITLPAEIASIGRQAFWNCELLESLRFLTQDPSLPSAVAAGSVAGSFRGCSNVVVYGYKDAQAVRDLVAANTESSSNPWYGGKGFSFTELVALDGVAVDAIADQDYTGAAVKPPVRAIRGATRLVEGEDYELTYRDNVAAGQATAVVTGVGRWVGQIEVPFTIKPAKMSKVEFSALGDKLFDGDSVSYAPVLRYLERRLVEGSDYTLSYADSEGNMLDEAPSKVGSYRLVATGQGSFAGTRYRTFRIVATSISDVVIENIGQKEYTGAPIEPDPNVMLGGKYLTRDIDYVLTYSNNVERGQAQVVVRGIGGFEGQQSTTFNIVAASLGNAAVCDVSDVSLESLAGSAVAFDPVVVCNGTWLLAGTDYTFSYAAPVKQDDDDSESADGSSASNGTRLVAAGLDGSLRATALRADEDEPGEEIDAPSEAGSYFVVIKGKGAYRGSKAVKFNIVDGAVEGKVDLSGATVDLASSTLTYNGTIQQPAVTVRIDGRALAEGTDYVVSYTGNRGPTTSGAPATVTIHGLGGYAGSKAVTFEIVAASISAADISDVTGARYAGGKAVTPPLVVKVNGRSLVEGSDYTVTYGNNTAVGKAYALVQGIGGYAAGGTIRKEFTIAPSDIGGSSISIEDREYSGSALAAQPVIQMDGVTLKAGADYTLSYADAEGEPLASAPTQAGSYQVIAKGRGNYTGSIASLYTIVPKSIAGARISAASQTYTGAALTPEVTVRLDKTILGEDDFELAYSNNRNAGTATITVTGKGNYAGTATSTFMINPQDISPAVISVKAATYTGSNLKPATTVKVGSVTLKVGTDYTLTYANNKNASSNAKVTVTGKGNYTGAKTASFTISPASQVLTLKAKSPKLKAAKLKKAKRTIAAKKAFTLTGAKTTVTYAKAKGSSSKLSINKKTGKITVAKGTKKKVYKIKVKVTAAKTANYLGATKTVSVKVKVV